MMLDPESSAYTRESLYKRLGGYDVIAAFVHDLMPRLRADRALAGYWEGDKRRRRAVRGSAVDRLHLRGVRRPGLLCRPRHEDLA
jgi:hypothetical protein